MQRIPCVSIIVENTTGEVLLLLRENQSTTVFPNQWTLVGGKLENGETPEMGAHREFAKETGLRAQLSFWTRYDRSHPLFIVDQYIYAAKIDASSESLIVRKGQALQFFKPAEVEHLRIGYGFKALLHEYFLTIGNLHVHHA